MPISTISIWSGVKAQAGAWTPHFAGRQSRLHPFLTTALVTGLGLLPLALSERDPECEIEGPMETVILGGLGTSTLLNLLVLPTLALRYGIIEPLRESLH
jgi:Cu/Ag efflux pump CusA